MIHKHSRREMYDLVWAEPMTKVAARFGISGVGLAKACRRHDITVPPRGYWAKLRHGQRPKKLPLPLRGPGMADSIEFEVKPRPAVSEDVMVSGGTARPDATPDDLSPEPGPPALPPDMLELEGRVRRQLGKVPVARDLSYTHKAIAKLLSKDDELRRKGRESPYLALYYAPKFASPLQHRRLRIASSLFVALDRFRCDSYVWFDERESRHHFHVKVADSYASFQLDAKPAGRGKEPSGLRLELLAGSDCGIRTMWEDDAGKPIERNLTDVAVNLLLTAELRLRERIEASRREAAAAVEREERRRVAAEEAAKAGELERIRQQERVRERALLKDVGRWKRAKAIREFVQAVRERQSDAPPSELACSYSLEWALAHADFIDPVSRSAR